MAAGRGNAVASDVTRSGVVGVVRREQRPGHAPRAVVIGAAGRSVGRSPPAAWERTGAGPGAARERATPLASCSWENPRTGGEGADCPIAGVGPPGSRWSARSAARTNDLDAGVAPAPHP